MTVVVGRLTSAADLLDLLIARLRAEDAASLPASLSAPGRDGAKASARERCPGAETDADGERT